MRIDHDKVSGALYIKIRDGEYDHTEDFSVRADVYLDVSAEGTVLGLEALSFEDLSEAIEECGGTLEVPDRYVYRPADAAGIVVDPDSEVEITGEVSESGVDVVGEVREVQRSAGDVAGGASESVGDEEPRTPRRSDRRANR